MAPNILLVVLDALRRDTVEPYAARTGLTPAIAALARSGRAVPAAYATASWTLPSHASMFTGRMARQLGLGQAPDGSPQGARPILEQLGGQLLPRVLQQAGYATHAFSTNLWVSGYSGFDIGFDSFDYLGDHRQLARGPLFRDRPNARLAWMLDGLRARADDGAAATRRRLTETIQAWSGQPTFWFVNLCECHSPYLPPRPWNDLGAADRVQAALDAQRHMNFQSICLYVAGRWEIPEEAHQRMRHLYERAAAYMDQWLADILAALDRRGILEETLVIVTSDHGENFGEDGLIAHGFSLDERLIHVPLVITGQVSGDLGEPFSLADLPRLLAEVAGVEEHPYGETGRPAGIALAEYDPIGTASDERIRQFADRWQLDEDSVARLTAPYTCATDGRRKLVVSGEREMAFDLVNDPGEQSPLEPNGEVSHLRTALSDLSEPAPQMAAQGARAGEASAEELEAIERQMRLLGYM